MLKKIILPLIIIIIIFFEFLRDYIFINTNLQIQYISYLKDGLETFNYTDSTILPHIKNFNLRELNLCKWIMSLFFFIIYFTLGSLIAFYFWGKKNIISFVKFYLTGGLLVLIISFLFYILSININIKNQYNFYLISIELSHFIQSSLYPISFLLIFYYYLKVKPKY